MDGQEPDKTEDTLNKTPDTEPTTESSTPPEPVVDTPVVTPVETPAATEPVGTKKLTIALSKKTLFIIAAVVVLIAGAAGALFVLRSGDDGNDNQTNEQQNNAANPDDTEQAEPVDTGVSDVSFASSWDELPYAPIFTSEGLAQYFGNEGDELTGPIAYEGQIKFYKVGVANDKDLVLVRIPIVGLGSGEYMLLIDDGSSYRALKAHSDLFGDDGNYYGPAFADNVTIDSATTIGKLIPKETITYQGVTASKTSWSPFFLEGANAEGLTEVETIDEGVVYERVTESEYHPGVKQFSVLLKQPSGLYVAYRYTTDILRDDKSVTIKFNDGSETTEQYDWAMIRGGCGVVDTVNVLDKAYFGDLEEVGKANGEPVYQLKSADHISLDSIYDQYNYDGTREGALSKQEFLDNHGMIVVRNKLGYRVILVNSKYQAMGECAKPVVYLYPEEPTAMSVKVGADVTKSDPEYGDGWNVLAFPDGRILGSDAKVHPYLFWDGTGHGKYPEITEGFVVKSSNVEATLRSHLSALGLNERESADFLEFWLPLMPTDKPYIRLTWFGTRQMDELAPLTLSHQPDTKIRIFLDFQGLDERINLKPQRLTHPERKGFVLVEWGGLRYVY